MSGLDLLGVMILDGDIESWLYVSLGGEHSYNHVDRVRIRQQPSTPPGCPVPGSRRRPSIASHLDLATNPAHKYYSHLQFSQRHSDSGSNINKNHLNLQDYYSHIQGDEPQQYEEHYYESYANNCRSEENCHRLKENLNNDVCSLRRTRSLAVIREETYNDLQISSARNSRRSQLIPRAKLVNRSLIKERYNRSKRQKRDEDSTGGSGVDTQTSETRESDDYYSNLKRLDSVKIFRSPRHHDKSDLDSINSDYFKNSQHQQGPPTSADSTLLKSSGDSQFQVLEIELRHDSSLVPEATTSNSDHSDYSHAVHEGFSRTCTTESENRLSSGGTLGPQKSALEAEGQPVIAYDSVYLSSEESSGDTLLRISTDETTAEASCPVKHPTQTKESIEGLYTKVHKAPGINTKPKILSVTTKRGALERLTSISTSQILKSNDVRVIDSFRTVLRNNHYCSLPDINIGRSLKASEKIDAKLRSSYKHYPEDRLQHQQDIPHTASTLRKGKRARQRDFAEIDSSASANISLISIDDSSITNYSYNDESSLIQTEKQQSEIDFVEETLPSEDKQKVESSSPQEHPCSATSSQTGFLLNQTTLNFPGQFRIIVTDSQDNIIEEDSIESSIDKALEPTDGNNNCSKWDFNRGNNSSLSETEEAKEARRTIDIHSHHLEHKTDKKAKTQDTRTAQCEDATQQPTCCPIKGILKKDCRRRGKAEIHFPPPPPIACSPLPDTKQPLQDIFQAESSSPSQRSCSNDEKVIIRNYIASKMSRPQILHVVDSKRHHANSKDGSNGNVEKEFLERVDSVRCYWSKITKKENENENEPATTPSPSENSLDRNYVKSLEDQVDGTESELVAMAYLASSLKSGSMKAFEHGLESFSPTVEIIELNGEKQATIVKARNVDEPDFDHVRYKIMKPNQFQKDILNRSKKEAQFDGLIQYLQDYSFQELLSNNNIVIIEPVRTKIEKPAEVAAKLEPLNCKITGGSGDTKASTSKRHFFYQPVRVNRELLEEELPHPDTVRNVRKFFEDHVLRKQSAGTTTKSNTLDSTNGGKRRSLRYLTIDTSYGNGVLRKWDSASLSSGISSGDLSSPCECIEDHHQHRNNEPHQHHQHHRHNGHVTGGRGAFNEDDDEDDGQDIFTSEENLCEDEMCGGESYYISEDVLEKIRECGSTVTYYGGRVVNKSPELSPMTRAIMEEIHGKDMNVEGSIRKTLAAKAVSQPARIPCNACQPDTFHQQDNIDDIERRYRDNKHLGIQFKLVKSNSCSSRLELVGTEKCCQSHSSAGQCHVNGTSNNSPSPTCHPEESVRELVNRLESGTIKNSSAPRIIESKCIEKSYRRSLPQPTPTATTDAENAITINNHHIDTKEYLGLVDIINHVTVNNHLGCNPLPSNEKPSHASSTGTNKVPRNKNVDLAFTMTRNGQTPKTSPDDTNPSGKSVKLVNNREKPVASETIDSNPSNTTANEISQDATSAAHINQIDPQSTRISLDKNIPASHPESHAVNNTISSDKNKVESVVITNGSAQVAIPKKLSNNDLSVLSSSNGGTAPIKLLEKHYVANDKRLIEQRKYDEIEFEEFEVYSPEMAYQAIANGNPKTNGHEADNINKQQTNGTYRLPAEIVESFEEKI